MPCQHRQPLKLSANLARRLPEFGDRQRHSRQQLSAGEGNVRWLGQNSHSNRHAEFAQQPLEPGRVVNLDFLSARLKTA